MKILKWVQNVKEPYVLFLVFKDPRVPWQGKFIASLILVLVIIYTINPLDIIPDFNPIIGWMDDLVLFPLGITLVEKLLPQEILQENRQKASKGTNKVIGWMALIFFIVFAVCAGMIAGIVILILRLIYG